MSDIRFIRLNLKGLAISGSWDYFEFKNPVKRILFKIYGKFIYTWFFCFNMSQVIEMIRVATNLKFLMANAAVTLLYIVTVIKSSTMHFRKKRLLDLFDEIRRKENAKKNAAQTKIYEEGVQQGIFATKLFWYIVFTTISFYVVSRPLEYALLGPQEEHNFRVPLTFSSWFPFDKFAPGYYEAASTVQIMSGCFGAYYIAVVDTLFVTCMIFAINQFKLVQNSIIDLDAEVESHEIDKYGLIDKYDYIVETVKHHLDTIQFITDLDYLISPIIFLHFTTVSLLICAIGMECVISGLGVRTSLNLYYLMAILVQLFLYYWHANEVSLESINVAHAISKSRWYNFSQRVKLALLMIMIRAQKPIILSVGGFYAMSLTTFLMILRAAYSYLALFRKFYLKDKNNS